MKVVYDEAVKSVDGPFTNSLFQKRLDLEIRDFQFAGSSEFTIRVSRPSDAADAVILACVRGDGRKLISPLVGEVTLSQHVYDVYPFHYEDKAVRDALASVEAFLTHIAAAAAPAPPAAH